MSATLWKHQREAVQYAQGRRDIILHCGMGTGKSRMAIEILRESLRYHPRQRVLLGCPKAVMPAWAKQFAAWAPRVRVVTLDSGTTKSKESQIKATIAGRQPVVIVGNYESLVRIKALEAMPWDMLIWDEVHRLKSPSGVLSKWAARMAAANPEAKRVALSGTLLAHSPLDAFGVYRAVESPECPTFGKWWTPHRVLFGRENPRIFGAAGHRNADLFARKIAETTFYRKSEDVLDLPPLMFEDVAVELTAAESKVYREVERGFVATLDAGVITVQNALHSVLRLQQICGGFVKLDDAERGVVHQIDYPTSKQRVLREWLEDLGGAEPVVVFCRFHSDVDAALQAAAEAGCTASELSGRTKPQSLSDWQAARTNVLVAQIQSGGIGIDLSRAGYGCFYSLGYSLAEYLQAVARLHRPGRTGTTRFYHLIGTLPGAEPTVDARIYKALSERKEVIDEVLAAYHKVRRHPGAPG